MTDHTVYDADGNGNFDDPNHYSPSGIPGSGDEVSFAFPGHYFGSLSDTLDVDSGGSPPDFLPLGAESQVTINTASVAIWAENSATLTVNDLATGLTAQASGTVSDQGGVEDSATVNGGALNIPVVIGELVHGAGIIGSSVIESAGMQVGTIDGTTIYNVNGYGGGPNCGLATVADATHTDSLTVANIDVEATDTVPTPLIYIGSNAGEAANAMVEATNINSAAGATVGMDNAVGDGASLTVDNCNSNTASPAGLTNSLDSVGGNSVPTNIESSNWSGAVITAASGESFSTVSATWVVPTVSQVPLTGFTLTDMAEWVGIDGYNSDDVCQAGVLETVQTSGGQTTISMSAWVEWYPADAILISASSFQVNPGNAIKVTVETTGAGATSATFILDNQTTGQIYDTTLTAPAGTKLEGNSAEFIVETPELISGNQVSQPLLTDFLSSPVVFENDSATYANGSSASLSSAQSISVWTTDVPGSNGSSVQEAYGSIQAASDSVTVTEDDYWGGSTSTPNTGPTVTLVTESPNSGIAHAGAVVAITIDFSETVTVAGGMPTLALNDGGAASYSSGSGTDALTFDYTVQSGQNTNNLLISSINLNGATVTDTSGNNANFSDLTSFTPGNLEIYTTPTASVSASSFTVSVHQAVAASTFFSTTNPNGDSITQYSFEDTGGGSGYFTVGGSVEPNGQAFTVSANNLSSVQYVGGGSAGTDTVIVDAYDATAAAWVSSVSLSAVTTAPFPFATVSDLTEAVYIGYFGRAADPGGDAYWLNVLGNGSISETAMAASFSVQPEATALYSFLANPTTASVAQIDSFIGSVYEDLFNRAPDSGGLAYWQNQLAANLGNPQAVGAFILDVILGAQGSDQTTIANKVTVADYFTQELSSAGLSFTSAADTLAHSAIASVTSATSTVLAAEATITNWLTTQSPAAEVALVGVSQTGAVIAHALV